MTDEREREEGRRDGSKRGLKGGREVAEFRSVVVAVVVVLVRGDGKRLSWAKASRGDVGERRGASVARFEGSRGRGGTEDRGRQ